MRTLTSNYRTLERLDDVKMKPLDVVLALIENSRVCKRQPKRFGGGGCKKEGTKSGLIVKSDFFIYERWIEELLIGNKLS